MGMVVNRTIVGPVSISCNDYVSISLMPHQLADNLRGPGGRDSQSHRCLDTSRMDKSETGIMFGASSVLPKSAGTQSDCGSVCARLIALIICTAPPVSNRTP